HERTRSAVADVVRKAQTAAWCVSEAARRVIEDRLQRLFEIARVRERAAPSPAGRIGRERRNVGAAAPGFVAARVRRIALDVEVAWRRRPEPGKQRGCARVTLGV